MKTKFEQLKAGFTSKEPPRSIAPLSWYHGEEDGAILEEIARMDEMGCGGFVIESRPHREYLGPKWWHDLDISIAETKWRGMEVWIFDEEFYPSGIAGGRVVGDRSGIPSSRIGGKAYRSRSDRRGAAYPVIRIAG